MALDLPREDEEITIYLKVTKTVSFKAKRSDTIDNLKKCLYKSQGISENLQQLFFAGNHLQDAQRLADYDIDENSTVQLIVENAALINIFVKIPSLHKTITVEAKARDTIQTVKTTVEAKEESIQCDQFSLVCDGEVVEDDKTLASLNLKNESSLFLIFSSKDVFTIFVKTLLDNIVKLKVKSLFTVHDIKVLVASMEGISWTIIDQVLFYSGNQLENCKTLAYYDIKEESTLEMRSTPIQILVKPSSGKTITVNVLHSETIEEVKRKVSEKLKIPVKYQTLVFAGKRLENHRKFASYNIQKNSTLTMGLVVPRTECLEKIRMTDVGCSKEDTISILKSKIQLQWSRTVKVVFWNKRTLKNKHTLSSYGISESDELVVIFH